MSIEEFFKDLRSSIGAGAQANKDFMEVAFLEHVTKELDDAAIIDGCDPCHYKAARGMRVDGYWIKEGEPIIDLFITDFSNQETLESLVKTDVDAILKRLENFFISSASKDLHETLEATSQGYGLARDIKAKSLSFEKVNLYLITERVLSERITEFEGKKTTDWDFAYHVWDIGRMHKLATASQAKEELVINFEELFNQKIQCLPAHLDTGDYTSYLLVMPGQILSDLYGFFGSRLLEQNVRCFLQARGKINKGIRNTIINEPEMFFAFNNGITATAREVKTDTNGEGIFIEEISDFQIVNGGQTTASLFHTNLKDKASLGKVFVQIKLSVVQSDASEETVQKISEYANTQNKVNPADFFSNHPFHVRIEEFSRRILAPAKEGSAIDTRWFYERARGQYADAQSKFTPAQQKRFKLQNPKPQMFSKTDLGKFENVWDDNPVYVNGGAQLNFAKYAERIGKIWTKNPDQFNEYYYKSIIARAIIF
ncbi:MAG: AIPR family protein, partial [Nitrospina sp.]|nr:AIPR family protein [Nitrospina sp.]